MKVTICEVADDFWSDWSELVKHANGSDIVLLPELPAYPWFAKYPKFDEKIWKNALKAHDRLIASLIDLNSAVISTRPIQADNLRLNQAFLWDGRYQPIRTKFYLPNEEGFYEAVWFDRGNKDFRVFEWNGVRIGVLICSEIFFNEWARYLGRLGAHIIAVPRATTAVGRWLIGLKMTAIVSGAFVISSNRVGGDLGFSGRGWIITPEGKVLASTSSNRRFVTVDIDLKEAEKAKRAYPRNIPE